MYFNTYVVKCLIQTIWIFARFAIQTIQTLNFIFISALVYIYRLELCIRKVHVILVCTLKVSPSPVHKTIVSMLFIILEVAHLQEMYERELRTS